MDLACHPAEVAEALGALAKRHPGCAYPGRSTVSKWRCAQSSVSK